MKGPERDMDKQDADRRDPAKRDAGRRDAELGERLRRLEVPEHAPGFFAALQERLEAEATAAGTAGRAGETAAAGGYSVSAGRRDAAPSGGSGTAPKRRTWLRLVWVPIPAAAVVLALLWAFAGPLGIESLRPQTASAKEITQKALTAMAEAKALRCTQVWVGGLTPEESGEVYLSPTEVDKGEDRRSVVLSAEGSYRVSQRVWQTTEDNLSVETNLTMDMSYDNQTGVQRVLFTDHNGQPVGPEVYGYAAAEITGYAAGLPDPDPAWTLGLGGVARALRESSDAAVKEGTYEGRPTWTLSSDLPPNLIYDVGPDHVEVTVDQETGFPVSMVYMRQGRVVSEMHLEDLEINPELDADVFEIEFPVDLEVDHVDYGFSRVELSHLCADGADVVGYVPVLPTELPDGFVLTEVNVAEVGWPSGKEGMNPPALGVVSALYRRGFDQLVVSTRLVGDDPSAWSDPLAPGEGYVDTPETVTLVAGAFAGSTAEILFSIMTPPHLWAMNDTLVVTVSGDLTREELLAVAESLAPVG